ncbi:MAG: sterol desaturase family protein [Pseudomonadota bacterium]
MNDTLPVQAFRDEYRRGLLPARYCGACHVMLVLAVGSSGIALALWWASAMWQPRDLWTVPLTLLIANVVEYLAHRGPMHHRRRGLHALHTRHTGRHHRYFTDEAMHFESVRDFHAVLFPPVLLLFFGGIAVALGVVAALFLPAASAALFVATALAYYLLYELLHFLYHVPPQWRAGRLPGVRWLARLHRLHHAPRHMQQRNFNLVFPLCDWLVGTLDSGRATNPLGGTST